MPKFICKEISGTNLMEVIKKIIESSDKIIITNILSGDFEYISPIIKDPAHKKSYPHKTLDNKIIQLQSRSKIPEPYLKLGDIIVMQSVFKGDEDFGIGVKPALKYKKLTILWK